MRWVNKVEEDRKNIYGERVREVKTNEKREEELQWRSNRKMRKERKRKKKSFNNLSYSGGADNIYIFCLTFELQCTAKDGCAL